MMHNSIITFITIEQNLDFLIFLHIFHFAHFNAHKYSFFTSISQAKTKGFMLSHGKIGDNEKGIWTQYIYIRTVSSSCSFGTFDSFLAGLGRNVWCMLRWPINQFKPVQQKMLQALRASSPYTCIIAARSTRMTSLYLFSS